MKHSPRYTIEVFEHHAFIKGMLSTEALKILVLLCEDEGFTHLVPNDEGRGFKLIKIEGDEKDT